MSHSSNGPEGGPEDRPETAPEAAPETAPEIATEAAVAAAPGAARAAAAGGAPRVGIVMGSQSDWETMRAAAEALDALGVGYETRIVSAHRTPDRMFAYAEAAAGRGLLAIIAGAGGAAHLPGMLAAKSRLPVLGVPVQSVALSGLDSLLSIVQMPKGVPVATFAIGPAGAANAGLFAAALLAISDDALAARLDAWRAVQTAAVSETPGDA